MSTHVHVVAPGMALPDAGSQAAAMDLQLFSVRDATDTLAVVAAAVNGTGVFVAAPDSGPVLDDLVAQLRRLGPTEIRRESDTLGALSADGVALLELLASGLTLGQAATRLHVSRRTADRRLAQARARLGVTTTAEAVVQMRARQSPPRREPIGSLIGRDEELAALSALIADDVSVLVVADGALGKTSLIRAVTSRLPRTVHVGGGVEAMAWRDYWALSRGVPLPLPHGSPEAVASQVESVVGPDLLVVDDAHLADEASLAVLAALAGRVAMLVAARPDTADRSTVATLIDAGFTRVDLDPLLPEAAGLLAARSSPDLSPSRIAAIVHDSGGVPLIIEMLACGEVDVALGHGLVPRTDDLSESLRTAALRLAVADSPRPTDEHTAALVEHGLARHTEDGAAIRHALIADAIVAASSDEPIRRAHEWVASTAPTAGEAARHWARSGDVDRARDSARLAAEQASSPGERGKYLALAAMAQPDGMQQTSELLVAASLLSVAGRHHEVLDALGDRPMPDVEQSTHSVLLQVRAHWHLGDTANARQLARAALPASRGTGWEAALITEVVRNEVLSLGPQPDHEELVAQADALTSRAGHGRASVLNVKGILHYMLGRSGAQAWASGLSAAEEEGDLDSLMRCSNNLIAWHESSGDPVLGLELARSMAARAEEAALGDWQAQFLAMAANLLYHRGAFAEALSLVDSVEGSTSDARTRGQVRVVRIFCMLDLGLLDEAAALLPEPDHDDFDWLRDESDGYLSAQLAFLSGRATLARDILARILQQADGHDGSGIHWFSRSLQAWVQWELGEPVPLPGSPTTMPVCTPLVQEVRGVALLAIDPAAAVAVLDEAATTGRHWSYATSVRAQWGAAEARRLAKRPDAIDALLTAEAEAIRGGLEPLLARIRRSLRLAGVARSVPRALDRSGLITARERAVLDLVAQGRSQTEIARRLGVGRPTVRRLIERAKDKLKAGDTLTAALWAASQDADAEPPA